MKRLLAILPLVLVAGCGAQAQPSSVDKFDTADERAVAQQVEDLQEAGERRKPEDICANILARSLVTQIEAAGADCTAEMQKAIEDADDYDLDVDKITIDGTTATVTVRRGEGDDASTETMEFARENDQWRATSLSAG